MFLRKVRPLSFPAVPWTVDVFVKETQVEKKVEK